MAPAAATRTRGDLAAAIHAEIAVFLQSVSGGVRAINDGPCAAFAGAVHARLGADPRILIIRTADFRASGCFGSPRIKSKRVKQISPASKPPAPLSWGDLDTLGIIQDAHCWLMFQGRHYDAEAPEGVDSLFDLPFFRCALVDRIVRRQPYRVRALLDTPWWRRSFEMDHALQTWAASRGLIQRAPPPVWETVTVAVQRRGALDVLLACMAGAAFRNAGRIHASSSAAIFNAARHVVRYCSS